MTVPAPLRVLVVEDDRTLSALIADIVEDAGHTLVGIATSAAESLALAAEDRPDLALVDFKLTDGLTGPEIGAHLARERNVAVVFVTGQHESHTLDAVDVLGLVAKPFSVADLTAVLDFVAQSRLGHAPSRPAALLALG